MKDVRYPATGNSKLRAVLHGNGHHSGTAAVVTNDVMGINQQAFGNTNPAG